MANVTLKIKIDVASLDAELQKAVEKIRQQLEKIGEIDIQIPKGFNKDAGEVDKNLKKIGESTKKVGEFSKRDLGMLANQMLASVDVGGKLQGQLSNLATGLVTGGAIGAAFAGFAAILNLINTRHDDQIQLINQTTSSLQTARANLTLLIQEYEKLIDPSFVEQLQFAALSALGLGPSEIAYKIEQLKKLRETFQSLAEEESTVKFRLENQIKINEELRDSAKTAEEFTRYQKIINELQAQYNKLLGIGTTEIVQQNNTIKTDDQQTAEERIEIARRAAREIIRANADILQNHIAMNKKIKAAEKETRAAQATMRGQNAADEIATLDATFSLLQGSYAQHTAIFKTAAAAQAIINTIAAAQAALAPPPLGIGPVFGPALAALVVTAGMARVASILATDIPGFFAGGFTGEGNRKEEKGIVHAGEYVFEQPLVSREPERFALLHNMLRSGVTLADMFNRLAVPSPALTLPGGVPAGAVGSGGGSTALLQSIDKTLKELTDKGNDKMEVVGEVRLKDQDIYISFKRGEKKMLKRGTVNG